MPCKFSRSRHASCTARLDHPQTDTSALPLSQMHPLTSELCHQSPASGAPTRQPGLGLVQCFLAQLARDQRDLADAALQLAYRLGQREQRTAEDLREIKAEGFAKRLRPHHAIAEPPRDLHAHHLRVPRFRLSPVLNL